MMSRAEVGEVIERCKYLIITANKDYAIVKSIAAERGIQPRMARKYVAEAHKQLREQVLPDIDEERTKAIGRYELIISKCIAAGQFKTAAMTQEKIDRLLGTQSAIKLDMEVSGKKGGEPIKANGFMAMIVDARGRADRIRDELERERRERNGG